MFKMRIGGLFSGMDVEVGNEASPYILILIGTMDSDLSVVVAQGSERGNQPRDGICVLISGTVLAW
jgi:hypothetical protein